MKKSVLLLSLLWGALSAWAHDVEVNGVFYDLDEENRTARVTYQGDSQYSYENEYSGDVVIPETVSFEGCTYSGTGIEEYCFWGRSSMTSITIPNSLTSVGNRCFYG